MGVSPTENRRLYTAHHNFGSYLLTDGVGYRHRHRGQIRHSSIQITVDVYGHLEPGRNRQAVNRLPTIKDAPSEEELKKASGG